MRVEATTTTDALVGMLNAVATAGFECRALTYGTHTGDAFASPWTGPIVWELYVTGYRGRGEDTDGEGNDWGMTVARLTHLDEVLAPFGAEAVFTMFGDEPGMRLRLRDGRRGPFSVPR